MLRLIYGMQQINRKKVGSSVVHAINRKIISVYLINYDATMKIMVTFCTVLLNTYLIRATVYTSATII